MSQPSLGQNNDDQVQVVRSLSKVQLTELDSEVQLGTSSSRVHEWLIKHSSIADQEVQMMEQQYDWQHPSHQDGDAPDSQEEQEHHQEHHPAADSAGTSIRGIVDTSHAAGVSFGSAKPEDAAQAVPAPAPALPADAMPAMATEKASSPSPSAEAAVIATTSVLPAAEAPTETAAQALTSPVLQSLWAPLLLSPPAASQAPLPDDDSAAPAAPAPAPQATAAQGSPPPAPADPADAATKVPSEPSAGAFLDTWMPPGTAQLIAPEPAAALAAAAAAASPRCHPNSTHSTDSSSSSPRHKPHTKHHSPSSTPRSPRKAPASPRQPAPSSAAATAKAAKLAGREGQQARSVSGVELPAFAASGPAGPAEDFEEVWELLRNELQQLLAAAKLAKARGARLEQLDAEMVKLQGILNSLGQQLSTATTAAAEAASPEAPSKTARAAALLSSPYHYSVSTTPTSSKPAGSAARSSSPALQQEAQPQSQDSRLPSRYRYASAAAAAGSAGTGSSSSPAQRRSAYTAASNTSSNLFYASQDAAAATPEATAAAAATAPATSRSSPRRPAPNKSILNLRTLVTKTPEPASQADHESDSPPYIPGYPVHVIKRPPSASPASLASVLSTAQSPASACSPSSRAKSHSPTSRAKQPAGLRTAPGSISCYSVHSVAATGLPSPAKAATLPLATNYRIKDPTSGPGARYHMISTPVLLSPENSMPVHSSIPVASTSRHATRDSQGSPQLWRTNSLEGIFAEDPAFSLAKREYLSKRSQAEAGNSQNRWLQKILGTVRKGGGASELGSMVQDISSILRQHKVPIAISRAQKPSFYDFNGKQLYLKQQNGLLLARVGGGYQELWDCLAKMAVPGSVRSPSAHRRRSSSLGGGAGAAGVELLAGHQC